MYTQVWMKFLPVIRIMLKRSITSPQVFKTNRTDFDKAGGGKKAGYKFLLELKKGKLKNKITSAIAKDLLTVLQQDAACQATLAQGEFELDFNPKCELGISCTPLPDPVAADPEASVVDAADN
jgi:hypothetical protein